MVTQRHARGVVRERPQPAGFVERKAAEVGDLGSRATLHEVFVQCRRPVAAQINGRCLRDAGGICGTCPIKGR